MSQPEAVCSQVFTRETLSLFLIITRDFLFFFFYNQWFVPLHYSWVLVWFSTRLLQKYCFVIATSCMSPVSMVGGSLITDVVLCSLAVAHFTLGVPVPLVNSLGWTCHRSDGIILYLLECHCDQDTVESAADPMIPTASPLASWTTHDRLSSLTGGPNRSIAAPLPIQSVCSSRNLWLIDWGLREPMAWRCMVAVVCPVLNLSLRLLQWLSWLENKIQNSKLGEIGEKAKNESMNLQSDTSTLVPQVAT